MPRVTNSRGSLTGALLKLLVVVIKVIKAYADAILAQFSPPKQKSIVGWNVLITGSGHGLGKELSLKFANQGANIVLVDINQANNELVKREIEARYKNVKVLSFTSDIRNESDVADLAAKVRAQLGDIDVLVNNAGIVQCLPMLELSPALVERTFQVNTLAHIWTVRNFLPAMIKRQRGHIVAVSSIAGIIGGKFLTDYCASKFAVVGFMDALDKELHDGGLNANVNLTTVCPSSMSTGMFQTFTSRFSWLLPVLSAEQVASRVVDAVKCNEAFIVLPPMSLLFYRLSFIIPPKVTQVVQEYLDYGVQPHKAD